MSTLPFIVGLRTMRPIGEIEDWLAIHCGGRWDVRLQDMAEDLKHKELVISFEKAEDHAAFKAAFAKAGPAQGKKPFAA